MSHRSDRKMNNDVNRHFQRFVCNRFRQFYIPRAAGVCRISILSDYQLIAGPFTTDYAVRSHNTAVMFSASLFTSEIIKYLSN